MNSLTILMMNNINVLLEILSNKINKAIFHSINNYLSNVFIVTKFTTITN